MKRNFTFIIVIFLSLLTSKGQTNNLSLGLVKSFQLETQLRKSNIESYENPERKSTTQFSGTGLHFEKRIKNNWGFNLDIIYVDRHYEMVIPFNGCYFNSTNGWCQPRGYHTKSFGYKTLEIPIGVSKYFLRIKKTEISINANVITSFDFDSYYNEYRQYNISGFNLFSGSLRFDLGMERNIGELIKIKMAPFIRIICLQREDLILDFYKEPYTHFDNFGISLLVLMNL